VRRGSFFGCAKSFAHNRLITVVSRVDLFTIKSPYRLFVLWIIDLLNQPCQEFLGD